MRQRELLVGIAAILGLTPHLAAQSAQLECARLELPAGKDRVEVRVPLGYYTAPYKSRCFEIKADENAEFGLEFDADLSRAPKDPTEYEAVAHMLKETRVDGVRSRLPYYEVFARDDSVRREVHTDFNQESINGM